MAQCLDHQLTPNSFASWNALGGVTSQCFPVLVGTWHLHYTFVRRRQPMRIREIVSSYALGKEFGSFVVPYTLS